MTFFLDSLVKGSLIVGLALMAVLLLRRQSASFRHSILSVAMTCGALMPALNLLMPVWEIKVLPASAGSPAEKQVIAAVSPIVHDQISDVQPRSVPAPAPTSFTPREIPAPVQQSKESPSVATRETMPPPMNRRVNIESLVGLVWITGALLGFALLLAGVVKVAWIASRSEQITTGVWASLAEDIARRYGLRQPVRLFRSRHPSVLATWGMVRPEVLLPAGAEDWGEDRIHAVLSHELAHVSRRDWLIQILAGGARATCWFNPLFWIAYNRLRQESEQACDDAVITRGFEATDYAAHLLAVARTLNVGRGVWSPALLMARPSTLQGRIAAMLNPAVNRRDVTPFGVILVIALFLCVGLPVAALRASASTTPAPALAPIFHEEAVVPVPQVVESIALPVLSAVQRGVPEEMATVEGIVTRTGTTDGLAGAIVTLTAVAHPTTGEPVSVFNFGGGTSVVARARKQYEVTTGNDGRFRIAEVPAGAYVLTALKNAYSAVFKAPGPATLLNVGAGDRIRNLKLDLLPGSTVYGRVMDQNGDPVEGVQVDLLLETYAGGRRTFQNPGLTTLTDDKGEFRKGTLLAGDYLVVARPQENRRDFSPTYYPGVSLLDDAVKVTARSGEDLHGVNFRLSSAPLHSVRFALSSTTPVPADLPIRIRTTLLRRDGFESIPTTDFDSLGANRYVVPRLVAGTHRIEVTWGPGYGAPQPNAVFNATIVDRDIDLGTVSIGPLRTIIGRVSAVDGNTIAVQRLETVRVTQWGHVLYRGTAPLSKDGSFKIELPEGRYYFEFSDLLPDSYVASVKYGAGEVLDTGVAIDREPSGPVEIGIATGIGNISGVVKNAKGDRISGARVALTPVASRQTNSHLVRTTVTDVTGAYSISNIPPGEYNIVALETFLSPAQFLLSEDAARDPEFMKQFEMQQTRIVVDRGARKSVNLQIVRNFK